jgi:hypothetical protein
MKLNNSVYKKNLLGNEKILLLKENFDKKIYFFFSDFKISFLFLFVNIKNIEKLLNSYLIFLRKKNVLYLNQKVFSINKIKMTDSSSYNNLALKSRDSLGSDLKRKWADTFVDWYNEIEKSDNCINERDKRFIGSNDILENGNDGVSDSRKFNSVIKKKKYSKKKIYKTKNVRFSKQRNYLDKQNYFFLKENFLQIKLSSLKALKFKNSKKQNFNSPLIYNNHIVLGGNNGNFPSELKYGLSNKLLNNEMNIIDTPRYLELITNSLSLEKKKKIIEKAPVKILTTFYRKQFKTKKYYEKKMSIVSSFIEKSFNGNNLTKQFNPLGDFFIFKKKNTLKSTTI